MAKSLSEAIRALLIVNRVTEMHETSEYNEKIKNMLTTFGIKYSSQMIDEKEMIMVDRTSMLNICAPDSGASSEDEAYTAVRELICDVCGTTAYVTWSGRTDEWLGVAVFKR